MESANVKKYQSSREFYDKNPDKYELHKQKALEYYYKNKELISTRNKEKRLKIRRLKIEQKVKTNGGKAQRKVGTE
jgi:hypothetical protein